MYNHCGLAASTAMPNPLFCLFPLSDVRKLDSHFLSLFHTQDWTCDLVLMIRCRENSSERLWIKGQLTLALPVSLLPALNVN